MYLRTAALPHRQPVSAETSRESRRDQGQQETDTCSWVILLCTSNFHLHHLTLRSRPALGKISTDPSCFRQDATLRKILRKYVHLSAHGKLR